jgi:hypothetical protein
MSVTGNRDDNIISNANEARSSLSWPSGRHVPLPEYYSQRAYEGGLITSAGNAPIDKRH